MQTALTKLYLTWPKVRPDTAAAYARRCVVNAAMDYRRSLFSRREPVSARLPDLAAADPERGASASMMALLAALPAGMRAAVVLRYVEGLSSRRPRTPWGAARETSRARARAGLNGCARRCPRTRDPGPTNENSAFEGETDMPEVVDLLQELSHASPPGPVGPDTVAADVARGHRALRQRRRYRLAGAAGTVAVGVTAVMLAVPSAPGPAAPTRPVS